MFEGRKNFNFYEARGFQMMTFEELNVIRELNKRLVAEKQKLQGFQYLISSITPQFSRTTYRKDKKEISYTCLDVSPKNSNTDSKVELIASLIVDTEKIISDIESQIENETPLLIKKIQGEVQDQPIQSILLYRYVFLKSFREIGFMLHYSERFIYKEHKRFLKLCS